MENIEALVDYSAKAFFVPFGVRWLKPTAIMLIFDFTLFNYCAPFMGRNNKMIDVALAENDIAFIHKFRFLIFFSLKLQFSFPQMRYKNAQNKRVG
ncbi:hypothetical protein [Mucilaginibacter gilvus]|uniref:Uncharacterized protein n=1 Tax=Mucilaginibacter gilvus TaxID=2305909 RepID=A0A444MSM6_9SPHI|nr:hypothetical protein [Mucilaginibacter gilvus]RWY55629.1 hypothetical protein EPL05_04425 [Mucilaginibacter gilvus]